MSVTSNSGTSGAQAKPVMLETVEVIPTSSVLVKRSSARSVNYRTQLRRLNDQRKIRAPTTTIAPTSRIVLMVNRSRDFGW
jgi:hypothetical protein